VTPAYGLPLLTAERAAAARTESEAAADPEVPAADAGPTPTVASPAFPADVSAPADVSPGADVSSPAVVADEPVGGPGDTVVVPAVTGTEPGDAGANPAQEPSAADEPVDSTPPGWFSSRREHSEQSDYWDADAQLAGQVYPPMETADTRLDLPVSGDSDANGSASRRPAPELDDDAPPFATAPFAPVPRLNRVRAAPIPPVDSDEDEDNDESD
jgi:hypothetical protein